MSDASKEIELFTGRKQSNQLELMSGNTDIEAFHLEMRNRAGIDLTGAITDAQLERTIEGASSLTITVEDDLNRTIQKSPYLGRKMDVNIDGLWFTLVGVSKTGRSVRLTFEDRNVNALRYYDSFIFANRKDVSRAQFVVRMLQEVKEFYINGYIPELFKKQVISDIQPGQILVTATGAPVTTAKVDTTTADFQRAGGASLVANLSVKGVSATAEQVSNANIILQTGVQLGVRRKLLVCAIMTAIAESRIINDVGGDRDSVGIFQQRASQGWPATRVIPVDASAFYSHAQVVDNLYPYLSYNDLCQDVQHSGTPDVYGQYQAEADKFVTSFGISGQDFAVADPKANNQKASTPTFTLGTAGQYTRGALSTLGQGQTVLTKETSWACMGRLASEVGWRCFCVSGTIYFISDEDLFAAKPFMTISEDVDGIDNIDYDFDEGKRRATAQVTAHLARWSAPPGSTVQIINSGRILNGKWLVNDVSRSLYDTIATIRLIKPQPVLPEPVSYGSSTAQIASGVADPPTPGGGRVSDEPIAIGIQAKIVAYATSQIGVPYGWGKEDPGVSFDCSGLTQAAYASVGIQIPRVAADQYAFGPPVFGPQALLPGDLVFFKNEKDGIHHVGVYIGNGNMIDAPQTGELVRVDDNFQNRPGSDYFGATRPWAKHG